ncbi:MAG: LuxR C-terminal-related transcriptional regulator [Spirochaetaceae bacterium]
MTDLIIKTKLNSPKAGSNLIKRHRLLDVLEQNNQHNLILVSASAGFGKTTLITEWLQKIKGFYCWYSLDLSDNDPKQFLTYMIATLQTVNSAIGENILTMIHSPGDFNINVIFTNLINEITASEEDIMLILDDFHLIRSKELIEGINFFLGHLPPNMKLVIITREDPDLPLSRLRARDELTEIRVNDLRFNKEETSEFLKIKMNLMLSDSSIDALDIRTEGWIAGLQLTAITMKTQKDLNHFVEHFTGNHFYIMDYLLEEVLTKQDPSIQEFLLKTSILDRFCGSICDALLDSVQGSGQKTLEYLQQINLFIIPLDEERKWFRYHHLFADLIKSRQTKNTASLHLVASRWYEDHDRQLEAFIHATKAGDIDLSFRLLKSRGINLIHRGGLSQVITWFSRLSNDDFKNRPALLVHYASALALSGKIDGIEEKLSTAEKYINPKDVTYKDLRGQIASLRAYLALSHHDVPNIIKYAVEALELISEDNLSSKGSVNWFMGIAHQFLGDLKTAQLYMERTIKNCTDTGNIVVNVLASTSLGIFQEAECDLVEAKRTYKRIISLLNGTSPPMACEVYSGLSRIYYHQNSFSKAKLYAQKSTGLALILGRLDSIITCKMTNLFILQADGLYEETISKFRTIRQQVKSNGFNILSAKATNGLITGLIKEGRIEEAKNSLAPSEKSLSSVKVMMAYGKYKESKQTLEELLKIYLLKDLKFEQLESYILLSIISNLTDDKTNAITFLEKALLLGEPSSYITVFLQENRLNDMLLEVQRKGRYSEYIKKILGEKDESAITIIDELSEREIEVLKLIAEGLSNKDICEQICVALSTIKGHNSRIFDKLQVKRRTEAVAKAKKLKLI